MSKGTYRIYIYSKADLVITILVRLLEMNAKNSPSRKTTLNVSDLAPRLSEDIANKEHLRCISRPLTGLDALDQHQRE